jgi:hypothetical protein
MSDSNEVWTFVERTFKFIIIINKSINILNVDLGEGIYKMK